MKVFRVNSEIALNLGTMRSFTLYNGDVFFTDDHNRVFRVIYGEDKNVLSTKDDSRFSTSIIRVGNQSDWVGISSRIGLEIDDITIQYNRDKFIEDLIC